MAKIITERIAIHIRVSLHRGIVQTEFISKEEALVNFTILVDYEHLPIKNKRIMIGSKKTILPSTLKLLGW